MTAAPSSTPTPTTSTVPVYSEHHAEVLREQVRNWEGGLITLRQQAADALNEADAILPPFRYFSRPYQSWQNAADAVTRLEYDMNHPALILWGSQEERDNYMREREIIVTRARTRRGLGGAIGDKVRGIGSIAGAVAGAGSDVLVNAAPGADKLGTGIDRTVKTGKEFVDLAGKILDVATREAKAAGDLILTSAGAVGAAGYNTVLATRWGIETVLAGTANTAHGIISLPFHGLRNVWNTLRGQATTAYTPFMSLPPTPTWTAMSRFRSDGAPPSGSTPAPTPSPSTPTLPPH